MKMKEQGNDIYGYTQTTKLKLALKRHSTYLRLAFIVW